MKAIVTGGLGFIGSWLIKILINQFDFNVLNIDKETYASNKDALRSIKNEDKYQFLRADICDQNTVAKGIEEFKPDVIFHLAAESHVDRSIESAEPFIHSNIVGTYTLLDIVIKLLRRKALSDKFRFIHVSTDEVYGSLNIQDKPVDELAPYKPNSPYSASKAASDLLVRAWVKTYKLPAIITHCTNNYGGFQNDEKLIPTIIRTALSGDNIPIYGDGGNIRDWIYVEDHCKSLYEIYNKGIEGEEYNVSSSDEFSNIELVKYICGILDSLVPLKNGKSYKEQITFVKDRLGHDFRYSLDNSKILQKTSWRPRVKINEGIEKTVKWYLDFYERNNFSGGPRLPSVPSDEVYF